MHLFRKRKRISITGFDNKIMLDGIPTKKGIKNLNIVINGSHNTVKISSGTILNHRSNIHITGDNNVIEIGKTILNGTFYIFIRGNCCKCVWGDNTTCISARIIMGEDNSGCIIGNDCMLSNAEIRASDGHTLIDTKTGDVLNRVSGYVSVGNNCWIGQNSVLTKNARIPDNTMVGAMSLVTKKFTETNTIIAGVPAKVLRKNIKCSKYSPSEYMLSKY